MILLALVGNRPQTLTIKELLHEFLRHRVDVIRRRTEFLLAEARKRKHTVEGLLIAQLDIDQVHQHHSQFKKPRGSPRAIAGNSSSRRDGRACPGR